MISLLRALWNYVFRRKQLDRDLDEELEAYVELVAAEKLRAGMDPEEAYDYARRQTGGAGQVVQNVRDVRTGAWIDRVVQDVRYGIRTLANNPTFSLVAVGTLALGIGANTAMFSLLDQVVLRLLPVRHPLSTRSSISVTRPGVNNREPSSLRTSPMFHSVQIHALSQLPLTDLKEIDPIVGLRHWIGRTA
jgi:hypothetical protein